jgi:hypothetical protein
VTIIVAERFVLHALVSRINMDGQSLSEDRRTGTTQRLQSAHKVDTGTSYGDSERMPCELRWRDLNAGIGEREIGFQLCTDKLEELRLGRSRIFLHPD